MATRLRWMMLVTVSMIGAGSDGSSKSPDAAVRPAVSTSTQAPEVERSRRAWPSTVAIPYVKQTYIHCAGSALTSLSR